MMLKQTPQFWILFILFQLAFGASVFFGTQYYFLSDAVTSAGHNDDSSQPASTLSGEMEAITPTILNSLVPAQTGPETPAQVAEQANQYFANKQYDEAARHYERLIELDVRNIDAYNNLGITLHYLGRSTEALDWLSAGINLDATHQRIWLTRGFVQQELGDVEAARAAFNTAVEMDANSTVGQSAANFLQDLAISN